ncbi:hypothetical protein AB4259_07170 [Vibrio amylolyticus]|uniref:hypothetical protein n=1 Tax=Vibrio amylolyticus TaxID=2847292 RepID=UPI00354ADC5F
MMPQGKRATTPVISARKGTEALTVGSLMLLYFSLYTLVVWYERFLMPYIHGETIAFYWEVVKVNPFSETGLQYAGLIYEALAPLYVFQWIFFSLMPILSLIFFLIGRNNLKNMSMHEAAEGGKIPVLGRVAMLFFETKWTFLMLYVIGYAFFATTECVNWIIDLSLGKADFDLISLFLSFVSFLLPWIFIRPFFAFYAITIGRKVN